MSSLGDVSRRCLAVCDVPIEESADIVCSHVKRHLLNGQILDTNEVEGIGSSDFKRLVLLCSSEKDVDRICREIKNEEIQIENRWAVVKYQKALPSEIPNRWEHFEIPEKECKNPQLCADFTHVKPKSTRIKHQRGHMFPAPKYPNIPHQLLEGRGKSWRQNQHAGLPPLYNDGMLKGQSVNYSDEVKSSTDELISELECVSDAVDEETAEGTQEPEMPKEKPTKIIISNLPSSIDEEYLEMFFEDEKKYGGVSVFHIDLDEENATAVVEFEEPEAIDIVLNQCPIIMMRQEVEVSVFKPQPFVPPCTIEITGPSSVVCEDQLERFEMYFKSERRSGGGDVVECRFDAEKCMVLVTFGNEEAAQRVAARGNHIIKNENITVKLHTHAIQSKTSGKTDEAMEDSRRTIKVKGIDKLSSRDTVVFYFENRRRSGGGNIEKVFSDEEDRDVIYMTFENKQDAENVVRRVHHKVEGRELYVSLYLPPIPPPFYENKILVKGLKPTTTQDCLFNFIEAKSGFTPETLDYHAEHKDVVMVTFTDNADFQKLEKVFRKNKLEGAFLKVYPVPVSNCVSVANLASDFTRDTVEFYFENPRRSGGGPVKKVVMNEDDTCLVYFADYTIIEGVLERTHKLDGQTLDVKRYQECLGRPERETVLVCKPEPPVPEYVDYVCEKAKDEKIQVEDKRFTVKYQKAIACELPERLEDIEIPEEDISKPQSVSGSADGQQQSHTAPDPPSWKPVQQKPSGGDQMHMYAWPPGPVSVAGKMQGDGDQKMNQGGIPQQMPVHGQGHVQSQGQHPMQGHRHQQGHPPGDAEHGQGAGQGPQQNYQFPPGAPGQFPGFPMFGMPPNFQPDQQKVPGQNMPFGPSIPMFFDQAIRHFRPYPGFPMPQQQGQEGSGHGRHRRQRPTGPPPPYNGGQFQDQHEGFSTEVKSPKDRPDHGPVRHSQAVSGQDEVMKKLQAKLSRESQAEEAESQVAQRVEERTSHVVMNEKLTVRLHTPTKQSKKSAKMEEEKEDETEPPKTIKVKGVDKSCRDTVEFYFENSRRSGGGEIERIYSDEEDDDVLYITFKNKEDAENIVKKGQHHIEGKELSVSLYVPPVPPPSYENKFLIKGLQSTTTQDLLFTFIEAKTGYIPDIMDYHAEQEDTVMVTFTDNPDFQKLEKVFRRSKLGGASLKVYRVPISNCIIVDNLASQITKDTVEFYFENTQKSGGDTVEKVVMNEDDTCLVYFADYTIIEGVLKRTHKLGGQKLDVKRYLECLGRPEGELAERILRLPEVIVLKDVDAQKIKFMKHSSVNRSAIETQLDQCFTKITWPNESGPVLLVCTLTKEVKDCFKLVKQWKDTAEQNFNDFMKNIFVKKVPVLQEILSKVIEDLRSVKIDNPEAVAIFVYRYESAITVVGNKRIAESLSTIIDGITKKVLADVEKEREKNYRSLYRFEID